METVTLNIDGRDIDAQRGKSILEAALDGGIYIPNLCHHPDLSSIGVCRLCIVEVDGIEGPITSCTTQALNGMKVVTKTENTERARRLAMELMLAGHPADCSTCNKYLNCELQSLKQYLVVEDLRARRRTKPFPFVASNPLFVHDFSRCILCGRCVRACHELRGVGVLFYNKKQKEAHIGTASDLPLADSGCRFCGACAEVCPTGAIMDKEELIRGKNRRHALVPCRYACPAEIDVPRYIRFIHQKDYSAAAAVIREKVPFPGVLGYVCKHPCETACRRGLVNQSISIRNLKRHAAGHDELRLWEKSRIKKPPTERRVAIIGSGPAGLTAAYYLSIQGHSVTVFESLPSPGGMMRYGIPEYRLPREVLDREISDIVKAGVEIKTSTHIGSIDRIFENGYDAVLVAVGSHEGQRLSIPGAHNEGVFTSVDFLKDVHLGKTVGIGRRVVVLGGGNVAFDCARVARMLGADQVHLACLEARTEMLASSEEIEQGEAEGISILPSKTISRILGDNGKVTGVELLDVASFSFDEDRNLQLETVENSHQCIHADAVLFAIGQHPEIPEGFGLETSTKKLIEIDSCREGVFAAGDAVNGTGSVIEAIASGRKAAIAVDSFLEGSGNIDEKLAPMIEPIENLGSGEGFASMNRCALLEMEDETAVSESSRCLQCDLRLKIAIVKVWGSY